jgi:putative membrane protein
VQHVHHAALSVSLTVMIVVAALAYLRGWFRLNRAFSPPCPGGEAAALMNVIPVRRAGSFLLGLFSLWLAVGSPIAALDHAMLTGHMIQHVLLMTITPPLLWLGVLWAPRYRPPLQLCWLAATAALVAWHVPAAFALGMRSEAWHAVEQISFFGTGLLFWWPVAQPWPGTSGWTMILYLFLATLPCDILSGFLVFSDRIAYAMYLSEPGQSGTSALSDQQCAGALMWTCVTVVYLVAGTILSTQLLSVERSLNPEVL